MQYTWNDNDLVDAYDIAVKLGTRNPARKGTETSTTVIKEEDITAEVGAEGNYYGEAELNEFSTTSNYLYSEQPTYDPYSETAQRVYTTEFHSDEVNQGFLQYEEPEEGYTGFEDGYLYVNPEAVQPDAKKRKNKKKTKQVQFMPSDQGTYPEPRESRWDQAGGEDYRNNPAGDLYAPKPKQVPDWRQAFPNLTAPPMPSSFPASQAFKKGDLSSLLMSWYMCGYHSGYYDAKQDLKREATKKYNNDA